MANSTVRKVILCSLILLCAGCSAVGPDYREPASDVEHNWIAYEDPELDTVSTLSPRWWQQTLKDPVLDHLVEIALAENLTLRAAGLRVLQSQQQLAIAVGGQYPQQQELTGSGGISHAQRRTDDVYDFGFNISWEADIWGRFRRQIESASALLDASLASYDGVLVSLTAQVAQNYLSIRTTQARLDVARFNVHLQESNLAIAQAKHDSGAASALDVEQAQSLLFNTRATIYNLDIALQQFQNALAVLLGRPPQDLRELLGAPRPVPEVDPTVIVGLPQDLIRRRPDIRTAERRLAAQSAQIGFAVSALYPHFLVDGSIGTGISTLGPLDASDLFSNDSLRYDLGLGFRWNLFNYGRLRSNVRLQDASFQQFLEDYRQTVLQAQAEVENALVAFIQSMKQLVDIRAAAEAAQRAAEISRWQYEDGLVNFNTVISILSSLSAQQDQLATAEGSLAANMVEVYRSLGGGWQIRSSDNPIDLVPEKTREEMLERTDYWDSTFQDP